jgi:hypothetical protein
LPNCGQGNIDLSVHRSGSSNQQHRPRDSYNPESLTTKTCYDLITKAAATNVILSANRRNVKQYNGFAPDFNSIRNVLIGWQHYKPSSDCYQHKIDPREMANNMAQLNLFEQLEVEE